MGCRKLTYAKDYTTLKVVYRSWFVSEKVAQRFISPDPIGIGDGVNVYAYCGGNPIMGTDVQGTQTEEKEPNVEEFDMEKTIYFFNNGLSDSEFTNYLANFTENVENTFEGYFFEGEKSKDGTRNITDLKTRFTYGIINKDPKDLTNAEKRKLGGKDAIFFSVGNTGTSQVDKDTGTGVLNINGPANTPGHEIGHLFGLQDRYVETRRLLTSLNVGDSSVNNIQSIDPSVRRTMPMALPNNHPDYNDYNPNNNLYSNGNNLTNWQIGVITGDNKETPYQPLLVTGSAGELNNYNSSGMAVQITGNNGKLNPQLINSDKSVNRSQLNKFHWSTFKLGGLLYKHSDTNPFNSQSRAVRNFNKSATSTSLFNIR